MEDLLDESDEEIQFSDKEVFTKIWTSPRQVFRFINNSGYNRFVTVLLFLAGISSTFGRASYNNLGDRMSITKIFLTCIVFGGIIGWISYHFYAALVNGTGKWLGANGSTNSIVRMLAYAMLPSIVSLIFLIPQIAVYGIEVFKSDGDTSSSGLMTNIFVYGSMFLEFGFSIWSIVLCVIGTSEVQKISIGKAILNLLLPVIILFVAILAILLLYNLIR